MNTKSTKNGTTNLLDLKTRKKNDFVPLEEGAYTRAHVAHIEAAMEGLATGKLRGIRMVKIDKRTGRYRITIGYGKRNTWFPQPYIPQGEFAECDNAEDAMRAMRTILNAARAGEFDDALEDLRKRRQEHAQKMIRARDKCGFHRMHQHEGQSLLPAPVEVPMQHVSHGRTVQAEAL
ncbi:hypothetical protein [Reyranella sp.]|uniref:hypothetical protein n=1 Tax=Reyranella sp. TaxID=1929291 RepID=UPI003D112ACF